MADGSQWVSAKAVPQSLDDWSDSPFNQAPALRASSLRIQIALEGSASKLARFEAGAEALRARIQATHAKAAEAYEKAFAARAKANQALAQAHTALEDVSIILERLKQRL